MGGLGNQLFQYAAGKALAAHHGTELWVDLSFLEAEGEHTKRHLELQAFKVNYRICTKKELERFTQPSIFRKAISKYLPFAGFQNYIANEKNFAYQEDFFSYPANTYLNGFWQSEKYFKQIRDLLLHELVIKKPLPNNCADIKNAILKTPSISLHIRRGDYVSNKQANAFHGVLPIAYYEEAVNYLNALFGPLPVFVFSDEMDWVKQNLRLNNASTYVDVNTGGSAIYDLHLMSLCRHNIIANSSFSWWGAWLNAQPDKVVIAPKQWFADSSINTADLVPPGWIKL